MNKVIRFIELLHRNAKLVAALAFLAGTSWIAIAISVALFRDTREEPTMPVVRASLHQLADDSDESYRFWFRQRRLDPYTVPTEHAANQ